MSCVGEQLSSLQGVTLFMACVCGSGPKMIRECGVEEGSGLGRHPMKRNMPCVSRPDSTRCARPTGRGTTWRELMRSIWKRAAEERGNSGLNPCPTRTNRCRVRGKVALCGHRRVGTVAGQVQSTVASCAAEPFQVQDLWAECKGTEAQRQELSREFEVPMSWWSKQPRITSKSGWITTRAAATLQRRTFKTGGAIHDQEDGRICAPR